ncbi:hypothetical protein [Kribbella catacumbae]|uniref:hypothetical protein n=1 Tax=Kribbella catacumbae TaxID=460086 RepID=UPI0003742EC8|nr:hypothetical protein [Kribbella catacumbae]
MSGPTDFERFASTQYAALLRCVLVDPEPLVSRGDYGPGVGIDTSRYTAPASKASTATLKVTDGIPTKGTLVLALYVPE